MYSVTKARAIPTARKTMVSDLNLYFDELGTLSQQTQGGSISKKRIENILTLTKHSRV